MLKTDLNVDKNMKFIGFMENYGSFLFFQNLTLF